MAIVTITSDLGYGSYSLAALKGAILGQSEQGIQLIDVACNVKPFNIVEGAFVFSHAWSFFPENSIHLLHINPFYSKNYKLIILEKSSQFFIAPNNGILPLIFDDLPESTFYEDTFKNAGELYRTYGGIVQKLMNGLPISEGTTEIYQRISLQSVMSKDSIRGTVIFIDHFGNLVTNVRKEQFEKLRKGRSFAVYFRHKDPITQIREHYHQVQLGEELCRFNSAGLLEIAINLGNAHQSLEINQDDIIQVDFYQNQ